MIGTMPRLTCVAAIVASAAMLVAGGARCDRAERAASAASRALDLARVSAQRVVMLRSDAQEIAPRRRPTEDMIALVNRTLQDVGIPTRTLTDLRAQGDVAIDRGPPVLRRQTVTCTLEPLTLADLGRFFARWSEQHNLWTPVRIEITHTGRERDATIACGVSFAATYIGEATQE